MKIVKDWFKASACGANNSCVEVRVHTGGVDVRNAQNVVGPVIRFAEDEWAAFLAGVREGKFDLA